MTNPDRREPRLFDHLVGPGEQLERNIQAECPGSFEIDCELEMGRRLDGQVGGHNALENARNLVRDLAP